MIKQYSTLKNLLAFFLLIIAILLRFLPHIPNFVPITALALFAGVYFGGPISYLLPILAMIVSDIFLGFHSTMIFVYASLLLTVSIGQTVKKHKRPLNVIGGTLFASIIFFIITNFGVWLTTDWYSTNLYGLIKCYYMALPFFRNSIAGDLFYVAVMFGSYEIVINYNLFKLKVKEVWCRKKI